MKISSILEKSNIEKQFAKNCYSKKTDAFVIFTDISGSTHLSVTNELAYLEQCFCHILRADEFLRTNNRIIVKTIGDEVMLTEIFSKKTDTPKAAEQLIISAIKFQKKLDKEHKIKTKMAIHLCKNVVTGLALAEEAKKHKRTKNFKIHEGDIFGKDVNLGARIMSIADEGQILISDAIFKVLKSDLQKKAMKGEKITVSGKNFKIDIPMYFNFKGFKHFQKVMQIIYNSKNKNHLSTSGYKFACLTFFDILGRDNPKNIKRIEDKIKKFFPRRSHPYFFIRRMGKTIPDILRFKYNIGVLFRLQNYETYTMVYNDLKKELGDKITSSFTNPIWYGYLTKFNKIKGTKHLSLWQAKSYDKTYDLMNNNLSKKQLLNLIILGYYDNFMLSKDFKSVQNLNNSFSNSELIASVNSFPVNVVYEKSFYEW